MAGLYAAPNCLFGQVRKDRAWLSPPRENSASRTRSARSMRPYVGEEKAHLLRQPFSVHSRRFAVDNVLDRHTDDRQRATPYSEVGHSASRWPRLTYMMEKYWWARRGSNPRPIDYESTALTAELQALEECGACYMRHRQRRRAGIVTTKGTNATGIR